MTCLGVVSRAVAEPGVKPRSGKHHCNALSTRRQVWEGAKAKGWINPGPLHRSRRDHARSQLLQRGEERDPPTPTWDQHSSLALLKAFLLRSGSRGVFGTC